MKIGILCGGYIGWGGGLDFIRMVINSLIAIKDRGLELHVIIPDSGPVFLARRLVGHGRFFAKNVLHGEFHAPPSGISPEFISSSLGEGRNAAQFHHIDMTRGALAALSRRLGLEVLLPSGFPLGEDFPVPWVGFIDDFQYKYFPQNYAPAYHAKRDSFLARMVHEPKAVTMLSRSAADDAHKFFPDLKAEMVPLPFAAAPAEEWLIEQPSVARQYGVGSRYFMISNQFWVNKRHDIAFAAFGRLAQEDEGVQLVCTGGTEDHRDPGHFPRLRSFIAEHGLAKRICILGFIPKLDQIALMKNCIAMIQATEFEGTPGGLSIYDAISLGVPTIVSDITVNREIQEWVTSYFPLNDVGALHHRMSQIMRSSPPSRDTSALRELGHQRRRRCAQALLEAARLAMGQQSADVFRLRGVPDSSIKKGRLL